MKKKYTDIELIVGRSSEEFMKKLSAVVDHYQTSGYQVEIQYQATTQSLSALVLTYK